MSSVYLKRNRWYLRVRDPHGRWISKASAATTKTEAKRLALELERRFNRQQLGLEPLDLEDGGGTVAQLMEWWIDTFLRHAPSFETTIPTIRKHIVSSKIALIRLPAGTPRQTHAFL